MAKSERRSMTFVTFAGNCDYRFWHMAEMRWRWYCEYDGFEGYCLAARCPRWRRFPIAEDRQAHAETQKLLKAAEAENQTLKNRLEAEVERHTTTTEALHDVMAKLAEGKENA